MKRATYLLFLLILLFMGCYSSYPAQVSPTHVRTGVSSLSARPNPNKCYVRCIIQDVYQYDSVSYLTYDEIKAKKYPHELIEVVTRAGKKIWEYKSYSDCKSDDPLDCRMLCLVEYPEEIEKIYIPVDSNQGTPFQKTFTIEKLIKEGGLESWEEIDCELLDYINLPVKFDINNLRLTSEDKRIIDDKVLSLMKEKPDIIVEIIAHTDSRGAADYNLEVSERRAQMIVNYLQLKGISTTRLVATGRGEQNLKNRCQDGVICSEKEHQENERIEFRVVNS